MASVILTLDPHKLLQPSSGTVRVEGTADYVPACLAIREAFQTPGALLQLHVTNPLVGDWLEELARAYGEENILLRVYTARTALQEKWNIPIPDVRDQEIMRSGLLEAQVTPREGQAFENVVLEHFFHDFFAFPILPIEHFARWLNDFDNSRWEQSARKPLPARLLRERLDSWKIQESNDARRSIIGVIAREPSRLRDSFARYKLLHKYPARLQERVLGEDAGLYRKAGIDPEDLDLRDIDLTPALLELEYFLTPLCEKIENGDELYQLLEMMSGHLPLEFNFVESILNDHTDWISADLLWRIERRFGAIRSGIETRLNRLRSLIAVPRPEKPDASWTAEQWLAWVRDEYMPYQRWLEALKKFDEEIAIYSAEFADWYYDHFIELKNGAPQHFAFSALYSDRQRMTRENAVTLVILLDNFNYSFFPVLRRLFNQQNVSLVADQPVFSLPPTATEVGKAGIIAVTGDLTDIGSRDYNKMVSDYWGESLARQGKKAIYLPAIGELQQLSKQEHDVYFLNYLRVDTALHEDSQEIGQDHLSEVTSRLQNLVSSVIEFARRFQLEKRLLIYVISDHGSTRIGKDVVNVLDKNWYKGIADIKHHRYIAISDRQADELPQMATAQCYLIDKKRFKTNQNYLAAKAYYRFVETTEDFYVHGGLTPEEVVVPFARFEFQPIQIEPPTVVLLKDQFRLMVKSSLEFELGNPNEYPLENLTIRLIGAPAEEVFLAALPPKRPENIRVDTVFKKEPGVGKTRELALRIQYDCQEKTYGPVDKPFKVNVESIMEVTDDFDL